MVPGPAHLAPLLGMGSHQPRHPAKALCRVGSQGQSPRTREGCMPEDFPEQTSPLWVGSSEFSTPGTLGLRAESCQRGDRVRTKAVTTRSPSPAPAHQAPQGRLLCLNRLSCHLLCFFQVCQSHTLQDGRHGPTQIPGPASSLAPGFMPGFPTWTWGPSPHPPHTCVDLRDWRMRRERAFRCDSDSSSRTGIW